MATFDELRVRLDALRTSGVLTNAEFGTALIALTNEFYGTPEIAVPEPAASPVEPEPAYIEPAYEQSGGASWGPKLIAAAGVCALGLGGFYLLSSPTGSSGSSASTVDASQNTQTPEEVWNSVQVNASGVDPLANVAVPEYALPEEVATANILNSDESAGQQGYQSELPRPQNELDPVQANQDDQVSTSVNPRVTDRAAISGDRVGPDQVDVALRERACRAAAERMNIDRALRNIISVSQVKLINGLSYQQIAPLVEQASRRADQARISIRSASSANQCTQIADEGIADIETILEPLR